MNGCINNHDPDRMEVRPDGSRICGACRAMYQGRKNAARRVKTNAIIRRRRAKRGVTPNGSNDGTTGTAA